MQGQPGFLLPGHPEPILKGWEERSHVSLQRPPLSGDPVERDKGPGLFLGEGSGKVYGAYCAWLWQELNGACRYSRQQGKFKAARKWHL